MSPSRLPRTLASNAGFTMIELVIGIAVLAILGGVAVAGYGYIRNDAAQTAMVNDLKAVMPAMEKHFNDENAYPTSFTTTAADASATTMFFTASPGVTLADPTGVTSTGYTVSTTHAKRPGYTCTLTVAGVGSATPACQ